jgi:uncharacterized integral membrane protein (TIGR00698 family)
MGDGGAMTDTTQRPPMIISALPALAAATVAVVVSAFYPLVGPLLVALAIGAVVANSRLATLPVLAGHAGATKLLLRLGVVLLGLKLPLGDIASFGPRGVAVVAITVVVTFTSTIQIGRRLGLDRDFVTLLASGFSICGAAAIAAVDDAVHAKQKDVALAVALVTLYGSAMIALVPWLSGVIGLTDRQSAIWVGASIHEVAQVAAAASIVGTGALAVAMTIKLGRVLLLAPTYAVATRRATAEGGSGTTLVPWFVVGFAIAAGLRSTGWLPEGVLDVTDLATTFLLAAGMFGLGLGIRARQLWPVPPQALVLATASTTVAAAASLATIAVLF